MIRGVKSSLDTDEIRGDWSLLDICKICYFIHILVIVIWILAYIFFMISTFMYIYICILLYELNQVGGLLRDLQRHHVDSYII